MKKFFLAVCAGLLALQGCNAGASSRDNAAANLPAPAENPLDNSENEAVATVSGQTITRRELESLLTRAYGLRVLMTIMLRDMAQQQAAGMGIIVGPRDIAAERTITLENLKKATEQMSESGAASTQPDVDLTPDQEEQMLDQLLEQENLSRTEFDVVMETNAYLRKIAVAGVLPKLTDEAVRQHFNTLYGEKVVVHYIVCNNMSDAADVRRDLAAGNSFDEVARARSLDRKTAFSGGELPPFTLQDNQFPSEFRQVAFGLKKGEVSDPIQIGKFIYIVKLVDRIPPAHARFEDYRDSVKQDLLDSSVQAAILLEQKQLAKLAMQSMHIYDPLLEQQWANRVNQQDGEIHDMDRIRQELDKEHATTTPATRASTQPAAILP